MGGDRMARALGAALRRTAARPEAAIFALVLGAVAYFYQAGGWNQNSRFDLTRALVERRTAKIDAYEHNTGDEAKRGLHTYCDKAPGVSYLGVPVWAAVWTFAGQPQTPSPRLITWGSYLATVFVVGIPSAIAAVMLFLLARALAVTRAWAAAVALAGSLATLAFPYATVFYGHQLVAALHLIAFALLVEVRHAGATPTPRRLALVGALLGAAIAVEYSAALGGAVIGIYALVVVRPWPRIGWALFAGAIPVALLLLYHWRVFGGPFTLPYEFSTQKHRHMGWFMGLGAPDWQVLRQILISEYRGLLYPQPWLWLAAPGLVLLCAAPKTRAEGVVAAAVITLHLWLNSSLVDWHGGWAMGPRYLVPCLPFVVVATLGVVRLAQGRRIFAAPLATVSGGAVAISFALMLAGTAVKPEVPVYVQQPITWIWQRFRSGQLAISTQSFDMAGAPPQAPPQAWNLGHVLGLGGLGSLVPLALFLIAGGVWLAIALRRDTSRLP
jgi:hypothetical protein